MKFIVINVFGIRLSMKKIIFLALLIIGHYSFSQQTMSFSINWLDNFSYQMENVSYEIPQFWYPSAPFLLGAQVRLHPGADLLPF